MTLSVSNALLWVAILVLLAMVIALARQVGVLFERVAPMGALVTDSGPELGATAPEFKLGTLDGHSIDLPMSGVSTLVFFLSPTCPVCKKLLPIIKSVQQSERAWLKVVLASDGNMPEHLMFWRSAGLTGFPYVLSSELGITYRVSRLPYAVLIDEQSKVRAKGLINSREQLESLFVARDLSVFTVQEYLDRDPADHQRHEHKETPTGLKSVLRLQPNE
jgi:methylamine dehydrogenase accessory protein MauD